MPLAPLCPSVTVVAVGSALSAPSNNLPWPISVAPHVLPVEATVHEPASVLLSEYDPMVTVPPIVPAFAPRKMSVPLESGLAMRFTLPETVRAALAINCVVPLTDTAPPQLLAPLAPPSEL